MRLIAALLGYKPTIIISVIHALGFSAVGFSVLSLWGSLDSKNIIYYVREPNANHRVL